MPKRSRCWRTVLPSARWPNVRGRRHFAALAAALLLCAATPPPLKNRTQHDVSACLIALQTQAYAGAQPVCQNAVIDMAVDQTYNIVPETPGAYGALLRNALMLRAYGDAADGAQQAASAHFLYQQMLRIAYRIERGPAIADPALPAERAAAQSLVAQIEPRFRVLDASFSPPPCLSQPAPDGSIVPLADPHGFRGDVMVSSKIAPSGAISDSKVTKSSGNSALDRAVLAAAMQTKYRYAKQCGSSAIAFYQAHYDPDWPSDMQTPDFSRVYAPATPGCEQGATMVSAVSPKYPDSARKLKLSASVLVRVTIDATGALTSASIAQSSNNADIDAAALEAAKRSQYAPGRHRCKPAGGTYLFRAEFSPD